MMLIKKDKVIMHIEPDVVRYKVLTSRSSKVDAEHFTEYAYQAISDVNLLLTQLLDSLPRNTTFELHIDTEQMQTEQLLQPEIKLQSNEIALFVEASIYKLFQLSAKNVLFDFTLANSTAKRTKKESHNKQLNPKQPIIVTICERHYLDMWINLLTQHDLDLQFLGCIFADNRKVNFLPWRQEKQKKQQFQFMSIMVCYIGFALCLFCYLWMQAQNRLDDYSQRVNNLQSTQQQLMSQLSRQLPNPSPSQKQIHTSLLLLSEKLPTTIWLESLTYVPQKIDITGYSFAYPEITAFNDLLRHQSSVKKSQIDSASVKNNSLLFEMGIELDAK